MSLYEPMAVQWIKDRRSSFSSVAPEESQAVLPVRNSPLYRVESFATNAGTRVDSWTSIMDWFEMVAEMFTVSKGVRKLVNSFTAEEMRKLSNELVPVVFEKSPREPEMLSIR